MKDINGNKSKKNIKNQVSDLYEIMKDENLHELEIKSKDYYVKIKRKEKTNGHAPVQSDVVVHHKTVAPKPKQKQAVSGETIKSPITGMYYRSASPTANPFVQEGDIVSTGKTLCIVEAMKVFNEIKAEYSFKILKLLVENGKPVTAGQNLFLIEKV